MDLIVGNDIGNSETKMMIDHELIKQPSVTKDVLQHPDVSEDDVQKNVANLLDELFVNISSKAVKSNGTYFVGKRANRIAGSDVRNINIAIGRKARHDIPVIMTLSMLSAKAIQKHYQANEKVPDTLKLNIDMVTAIPASEYSKDKAEKLKSRFLDNQHTVVVYVGEKPVAVTLAFNFVKVTQEGVPALYAFLETKDKDILKDYAKNYKDELKPQDLQDKKVFHVDIGDGTTEYIYTKGLNPVVDACSGELRGVGHATEKAKSVLQSTIQQRISLNRQKFIEIMRDPEHNFYEEAKEAMKKARNSQAIQILEDIEEKYMTNAAADVDIITVYGGGSIQFKDDLYDDLKEFADEVKCKLLWVPEQYAVDMNVKGMMVLMEKVFNKQPQKGE